MAGDSALDLSAIDPPVWRIMVEDVVYGPYTLGQMRSYLAEERLGPGTLVADGDGGAFVPAREQDGLRALFDESKAQATTEAVTTPCNYLITLRCSSDERADMIQVLNQAGRFSELMVGTFILNTTLKVAELRTQLEQAAMGQVKFVIVNADSGQLAWSGLGTDADQHARQIWQRPRKR